jgi:hypothetical protein
VASSEALQVAGLGVILRIGCGARFRCAGSLAAEIAAIQAGAVAPFGVQFDPIRRIGDHQERLALVEQVRDILRPRGVPAEDTVGPAEPQVAGQGRRILRNWWCRIGPLLIGQGQEPVNLAGVETCQVEVEVSFAQFLKFQGEQFFVPRSPRYRAVHQQPEGFHLGRRPLIAEDDGDFVDAELARGLDAQVPVDDLAVAARQHRDLESKFPEAGTHAIDDGVVFARIPSVEDQPINRPHLDF